MSLSKKEFLTSKINDNGEQIFHIKAPCQFIFKEEILNKLREKYLSDEEIGGIIWVQPKKIDEENKFIGDKITFIRNAIEDKPRQDGRNRKNAYLADRDVFNQTLKEVFNANYLPIGFHTHPTKGKDFLSEFLRFNRTRETSNQDKKVSDYPIKIGAEKLLLPQALVVGNDKIGDNLFLGIYNGFIAPKGFEERRKEVVKENMKKVMDKASSIELTSNQKIFGALAIIFLLIMLYRFRKYSFPAIVTLAATASTQLENTSKNSKYYNQSFTGDAIIDIPNYEDEIEK